MALCCNAHHIWPLLLTLCCISSSAYPLKSIVNINILQLYVQRGPYNTKTRFENNCRKQLLQSLSSSSSFDCQSRPRPTEISPLQLFFYSKLIYLKSNKTKVHSGRTFQPFQAPSKDWRERLKVLGHQFSPRQKLWSSVSFAYLDSLLLYKVYHYVAGPLTTLTWELGGFARPQSNHFHSANCNRGSFAVSHNNFSKVAVDNYHYYR